MGRILATDVHVVGPKGAFDFVVLPAGTELPDEYADQVTAEVAFVPEPVVEEAADVDAPDPDGPTGYDALSVVELKAELEQRDLPHGGKKADLIVRLEVDDKEREESDTNSESDESTEDGSETPDSPVEGTPAS